MPAVADRFLTAEPSAPGAHLDAQGAFFSVYAPRADHVELCLFDESGRYESARLALPDCSDGWWHGYLPGVAAGQRYGYRVYGRFDPIAGLRFNPHKLLIDPYARRLAGSLRWHDALYAYQVGSERADLSFDRRDSAPYVPKAVVGDEPFDWRDDRPPRTAWPDTIIYELHVRGFSRLRADLPERERGTFAALAHPAVLRYLQDLGITAVELLPVQAFARERRLLEKKLTNYWGYDPLAWFVPEPAYLDGAAQFQGGAPFRDGASAQMKHAVRQLHAAGIEVILDVVYNHTCEGDELGPTLSLRGFDNMAYYRLAADQPRHYINDSGCGNTLNLSHPQVIRLVLDSLRHWVEQFHIDGFRFDLGVALGREQHGFDPHCGFFDALRQDPVLARVKLIADPWDRGPGGYQLGNHPPGFAEWNGLFRDDVRRYWRGDAGLRARIAARLQGSPDLFDHDRRKPWASVNFITAHDGFTLNDLVSYSGKHNDANGEDNRDGSDDNASRNWGREGPTDEAAIAHRRDRVMRSLLTTLFCATGTPMLLAGDEFGQTQRGNNNAHCQDNAVTWLDWSLLAQPRGRALRDVVADLIALRKRLPLLRCRHFDPAITLDGQRAVTWFDEHGAALAGADWDDHSARLLGLRRLRRDPDGYVEALLLLCNAGDAPHRFRLPAPRLDYRLHRTDPGAAPGDEALPDGVCDVPAHACALLTARAPVAAFLPDRAAPGARRDTSGDSLSGDMLRDDSEPPAPAANADVLVDEAAGVTPAGGDVLIDEPR